MGVKDYPWYRSEGHRAFVRKRRCIIEGVAGHVCHPEMEAAHARFRTDGCGAEKPSDWWCFPACRTAHREQHDIGEPAFEKKYGRDLKQIAAGLWREDVDRRLPFERLRLPVRADRIGAPPSAYQL